MTEKAIVNIHFICGEIEYDGPISLRALSRNLRAWSAVTRSVGLRPGQKELDQLDGNLQPSSDAVAALFALNEEKRLD